MTPSPRIIKAIALSWFSMLGFDLFLHGGLLAGFYLEPSSFLLPPKEAFLRIPFGYAAFLLLAALLVGLMERMAIRDWRSGGVFGLVVGALIWGAFALGLYSVSTAPAGMMTGWFLGQTVELGVGGVVAGSVLSGGRLRPLFLKTLAFVVASVLVTIVLQNLGLAPAIHQ